MSKNKYRGFHICACEDKGLECYDCTDIIVKDGKEVRGKWVYGYLIGHDVIVGEIVEFTDEYFNTEFWYKVDPETVGKWTGLNDKNGVEIYEGDKIEEVSYSKVYRYAVKWNETNATIDFIDTVTEEVFHAEDIHLNKSEVIYDEGEDNA